MSGVSAGVADSDSWGRKHVVGSSLIGLPPGLGSAGTSHLYIVSSCDLSFSREVTN